MNLSEQGVRPGGINMGRVLRHLRFRTDQSRKVVYHRPPIYGKDNYGVENTTTYTTVISSNTPYSYRELSTPRHWT